MRDLSEIAQPPELSDGRLRLRALQPADKAAVVVALNDELAARFLWRPPFPYKESDFDDWIAATAGSWQEQHAAHWTATWVGDDEWLGSFAFDVAEDRQAGEIGYQVGPSARGRGVATDAARLIRDWALDDLGLERVEIMTDLENIPSQRVALAAGFHFEGVQRGYLTARGTRRDMVTFGIVPSDPRAPVVPLPRPHLSDGRIVVRPFEPDDAEAVAAACQDPLIQRCCYFVPSPYTIDDARRFMAEAQWELTTGTTAHCAICDAADGDLLGAVNLVHYPEREAGELGLWIVREARGRDIGTAALLLMIRFAFEEVGLERVEAMIETPNVASQRLVEQAGVHARGRAARLPGVARPARR